VRIFGSLKQILEKSPGTRVFITGRSHIQAEIEKCLCEKVKSVSLCPKKEDIIRYLHIRLGEDETPDCSTWIVLDCSPFAYIPMHSGLGILSL